MPRGDAGASVTLTAKASSGRSPRQLLAVFGATLPARATRTESQKYRLVRFPLPACLYRLFRAKLRVPGLLHVLTVGTVCCGSLCACSEADTSSHQEVSSEQSTGVPDTRTQTNDVLAEIDGQRDELQSLRAEVSALRLELEATTERSDTTAAELDGINNRVSELQEQLSLAAEPASPKNPSSKTIDHQDSQHATDAEILSSDRRWGDVTASGADLVAAIAIEYDFESIDWNSRAPTATYVINNGTSHTLTNVKIRFVVHTPGRDLPWRDEVETIAIQGGLQPGESISREIRVTGERGRFVVRSPHDLRVLLALIPVSISGADGTPVATDTRFLSRAELKPMWGLFQLGSSQGTDRNPDDQPAFATRLRTAQESAAAAELAVLTGRQRVIEKTVESVEYTRVEGGFLGTMKPVVRTTIRNVTGATRNMDAIVGIVSLRDPVDDRVVFSDDVRFHLGYALAANEYVVVTEDLPRAIERTGIDSSRRHLSMEFAAKRVILDGTTIRFTDRDAARAAFLQTVVGTPANPEAPDEKNAHDPDPVQTASDLVFTLGSKPLMLPSSSWAVSDLANPIFAIDFDPSGRVTDVRLARTSGVNDVDQAVMAAVSTGRATGSALAARRTRTDFRFEFRSD